MGEEGEIIANESHDTKEVTPVKKKETKGKRNKKNEEKRTTHGLEGNESDVAEEKEYINGLSINREHNDDSNEDDPTNDDQVDSNLFGGDSPHAERSPSSSPQPSAGSFFTPNEKIEGRRGIHLPTDIDENYKPEKVSDQGFSLKKGNGYCSVEFVKGYWFWIFVGITLSLAIFVKCFPNETSSSEKVDMPIKGFMNKLKMKYHTQYWMEFSLFADQVELSRSSNERNLQNNVFTLLTYGNSDTANEIANHMAEYAANRFQGSSDRFLLSGSNISEDYFPNNIPFLKKGITEKGNLIVTDFEKLSSQAARYFHAIGDKYTPFIDAKAVFIFVLKTYDKNIIEMDDHIDWKKCAKKTMNSLWSDLPTEILNPLIVRLSENVIKINPDKK